MSSNDNVSNVLGDSKQEVVMTPLSGNKLFTKHFEEGTDKLVDITLMKKKY